MNDYKFLRMELIDHVAIVTFSRPPLNHFNFELIAELLEVLRHFDDNDECRATVLCSEGKVFCAGGDFGRADGDKLEYIEMAARLYAKGMQLFRLKKPMIAAVHGSAIGGGLGLALVADFRVTCENAKFSANFTRLGIHPGFGTSVTLPRVVGTQNAELLFYTGRRIDGNEAFRIGLADILVEQNEVKNAAIDLAREIAISSPQAVQDTRATLRQGLADQIARVNERELLLQKQHMCSADFIEGVIATSERRQPEFHGK